MNKVEQEALNAYPVDMTPFGDDNIGHREAFQEGFERALKLLHSWACGKYEMAEHLEVDDAMDAYQDMKREIMSMYDRYDK